MIVAQLWKEWPTISAIIFGGNPGGLKVPGPGGIPVNPATGKCPSANYVYAYGKCWGQGVNPVPPSGGGLT